MKSDQSLKVTLYSTSMCPYCKMEEEWLNQNGIEHEKVMVDQDYERAIEMVQKSGQMGVPVTEIQKTGEQPTMIIGFDKASLTSLLLTSNDKP